MSKKQVATIAVLLLICIGLALLHWQATRQRVRRRGRRGRGGHLVDRPGLRAWAESLIELPGGETESLLFCLQTAIGAVVIGFGFGYLVARKKYNGKALGINLRKRPDLSSLSSYLLYLLFCTRSRTVARPGGVGAVWSFSLEVIPYEHDPICTAGTRMAACCRSTAMRRPRACPWSARGSRQPSRWPYCSCASRRFCGHRACDLGRHAGRLHWLQRRARALHPVAHGHPGRLHPDQLPCGHL